MRGFLPGLRGRDVVAELRDAVPDHVGLLQFSLGSSLERLGVMLLAGITRMLREMFEQHCTLLQRSYRAPNCVFGRLIAGGEQAFCRVGMAGVTAKAHKSFISDLQQSAVTVGAREY